MSIYTKTGDKGKTALFGGKRVWKYNPQIEAYGMVDEATCFIGHAIESIQDMHIRSFLTDLQLDLYAIMAYLSDAPLKKGELKKRVPQIEELIDTLDKTLPKLTRFVLPQGSEATARIHIARAKVRTAERRIVELFEQKKADSEETDIIIQYMNRLSDLLFILARNFNKEEKLT